MSPATRKACEPIGALALCTMLMGCAHNVPHERSTARVTSSTHAARLIVYGTQKRHESTAAAELFPTPQEAQVFSTCFEKAAAFALVAVETEPKPIIVLQLHSPADAGLCLSDAKRVTEGDASRGHDDQVERADDVWIRIGSRRALDHLRGVPSTALVRAPGVNDKTLYYSNWSTQRVSLSGSPSAFTYDESTEYPSDTDAQAVCDVATQYRSELAATHPNAAARFVVSREGHRCVKRFTFDGDAVAQKQWVKQWKEISAALERL